MDIEQAIIRICCLCNKIKSSNGWIEQDRAPAYSLSHGYCPQCYMKVVEGIKGEALPESDAKNKQALP